MIKRISNISNQLCIAIIFVAWASPSRADTFDVAKLRDANGATLAIVTPGVDDTLVVSDVTKEITSRLRFSNGISPEKLESVVGDVSLVFTKPEAGVFRQINATKVSGSRAIDYVFLYNAKTSAYDLKSAISRERDQLADLEELDSPPPITVKKDCEIKPSVAPDSPLPQALAQEFESSKILASCGDSKRRIAAGLATILNNKDKPGYLSCLAPMPAHARTVSELRAYILTDSKQADNLQISCGENNATSLREGSGEIALSRPKVFKYNDARLNDELFRAILLTRSGGSEAKEKVDRIVACCGTQQSAKACRTFAHDETLSTSPNVSNEQLAKTASTAKGGSTDQGPIQVKLGAADNLEKVRPSIAKYREPAKVLARQVSRGFDKIEAGFSSTAYAGVAPSRSNTASATDDKTESSEPSAAAVYATDSRGTTLQLPSGELTRVSIPFSTTKGFGAVKVETVRPVNIRGGSKPSVHLAQTNAVSDGASSLIPKAINSKAAVLSSQETGSQGPNISGGFSGGAGLPISGDSGSSRGPSSRSEAHAAQSEPTIRSVQIPPTWDQTWNLLKTAKEPERIMKEPAFVSFGKRVRFKGNSYGVESATRVINLDPYWKPKR